MPLALAASPTEPRARWSWPTFAIVVWVCVCAALAAVSYLKPRGGTVYPVYANAARGWWAGANVYAPDPAKRLDLYRYSPTFAVLASPFALLPPAAGNVAWKLANVAVFALGLWLWGTRVLPWQPTRDRLAGLFVLGLVGALGSFFNGQANLMVCGFMLLALTAVAGERWWAASGFLAAAALIKVFPLALALVLCAAYWRKLPVRFAVALAAGLALPLLTGDPEYALWQTAEWCRHLLATADAPRPGHRSLETLLALAGLNVGMGTFRLIAAAAGGVVLAVAVVTARRADTRTSLTLTAAWFLTWALLFGPAAENSTFSILAPVLAWAILTAFERRPTWVERACLLASLYLIGLSTSDAGGPFRRFFDSINAVTVGAVLFQLWLIADLLRARPRVRVAAPEPAATTASRRAA